LPAEDMPDYGKNPPLWWFEPMSSHDSDKVFTGSIPELYEVHLVPLILEPYALDLADRLASTSLTCVLEIAAGTGVVTRALASMLPDSVSIVPRT
jgi:hypothetical protein